MRLQRASHFNERESGYGHGLGKVRALCFVERFETFAVVRERNGMNDAMERGVPGGRHFGSEPVHFPRFFHIAEEHRPAREERLQ